MEFTRRRIEIHFGKNNENIVYYPLNEIKICYREKTKMFFVINGNEDILGDEKVKSFIKENKIEGVFDDFKKAMEQDEETERLLEIDRLRCLERDKKAKEKNN